MGTPIFAVPVLQALADMPGIEIVGVVTPPNQPAGRGRQPEPPPVKSFALERQMLVLQPDSLRAKVTQDELAGLAPDVIVVAAYGKLLPQSVLDLPRNGCLNLHPSLLPRYRGPTPVPTTILEGDETTGVTLMLLDQGMDTGPIIARAEFSLDGCETSEDLTHALFGLGTELLVKNLKPWVAGSITADPQDDALATVTHKLERRDGQADWGQSARNLERISRAFTPWPGLFTHWNGKLLKLSEVTLLGSTPSVSNDEVLGRVVKTSDARTPIAVTTSDGMLGLKRIQLEGRQSVTSREFFAGFPSIVGAQLG